MKKFTFILTFLLCAFIASGQDLLFTDFDGGGAATSTGVWSYTFSGDTLDNPVTDGINTSAKAAYFPAHWWMSSWYSWYGGFYCIRGLDPSEWANYTHLKFKALIYQDQEAVSTGDSVIIALKYEVKPTEDNDVYVTDQVIYEITKDGGNVWQEFAAEIPEAVQTQGNLTDVCLIAWTGCEDCGAIDMYYDDVALSSSVGIEKLTYNNGMAAYIVYDQLKIKMEGASNVESIQVFDIKGSMVVNKEMNMAGTDFSVPIDLHSGVYIVRVKTEKEILTGKFIR